MTDPKKTSQSAPVVVVTGCAGLIGSRVMERMSNDYRVVGFDVKRPDELPDGAEFVECDLTDDGGTRDALQQVRETYGDRIASVVHLAAYYDFSGEPSDMYRKLTYGGTRRMLEGLQDFQVEQFLYSSTLLVMAPSKDGKPIHEQGETEATWAYPEWKLKTEQLIGDKRGDIPATILRIAGVYDELGRSPAITEHVKRIYEKDFTSFFFPGDKERGQAFVHIDDTIEAIAHAVHRRKQLGGEEVFLIAEPEPVPYETLQNVIGDRIHGKQWPTIRIPKPVAKAGAWAQEKIADKLAPGDEEPFIKPFMVDIADADYPVAIDRARERLNWAPRHRLAQMLPRIVDRMLRDPARWFRENGLQPPEGAAREQARQAGGEARA
ncbi:MAG: NAD(P)-dependent oxidoreductase [Myxococcales bacterium]|jgi:nucleoside-diphosphate-sugar epimerase